MSDIRATIEQAPAIRVTMRQEPEIHITIDKTGPQGPPGQGEHYELPFDVSSEIHVAHNLGKKPAVTIIDTAGTELECAVTHTDANNLVVYADAPFSGRVILN